MTKVLVLNGPNLGRLGKREPETYGHTTHAQLVEQLVDMGNRLALDVEVRQSDHEGTMVEWLHEAADHDIPVILNAAAWSHYSVAVADAVAQVGLVIEVHISNVHAREEFRSQLVTSRYSTGVIAGLGINGYHLALTHLAAMRSGGD